MAAVRVRTSIQTQPRLHALTSTVVETALLGLLAALIELAQR